MGTDRFSKSRDERIRQITQELISSYIARGDYSFDPHDLYKQAEKMVVNAMVKEAEEAKRGHAAIIRKMFDTLAEAEEAAGTPAFSLFAIAELSWSHLTPAEQDCLWEKRKRHKGRRDSGRTGKTQLSIQRERDAIRGTENSGSFKVCGYGLMGNGTFCVVPPSWVLRVEVPRDSGLPMADVIEELLRARKENISRFDRLSEKYDPVLDGNKLIFSKQHNEVLKIRNFTVNWKRGEDGIPRVIVDKYEESDSWNSALELEHDSVSTKGGVYADETIDGAEGPKDFYRRCNILAYNDMEASAIVAYYYTEVAPRDKISSTIRGKEYIEMCRMTGRRLPKSGEGAGTLNNTQYFKGYLISEGGGRYSLSDEGREFVEGTVLGPNRYR